MFVHVALQPFHYCLFLPLSPSLSPALLSFFLATVASTLYFCAHRGVFSVVVGSNYLAAYLSLGN